MNFPTLYKTLQSQDHFEVRQYDKLLLAKVTVPGPFEVAYEKGREMLIKYLEGHNYKKQKVGKEYFFMLLSRIDGWEVACILPQGFSAISLSPCLGDTIYFEELKPRKVIVYKFNGKSAYTAMMKKIDDLKFWAKSTNFSFDSRVRIVVYKSFIPFMRKNEIHLDSLG